MQTRIGQAFALALLLAGCASAPVTAQQGPQPEKPADNSKHEAAPQAATEAGKTDTAEQQAEQKAEQKTGEEAVTAEQEAQKDAEQVAEDQAEKEADREDGKEVVAVDREAARKALAKLDDDDIIGRGKASYYHLRFSGRRTASGQRYDHDAMTAAHRTLPFGTSIRVTNVRNGKSVVVKVNDRGPFRKGRIIDVSGAAARALGLMQHGLVEVILSRP